MNKTQLFLKKTITFLVELDEEVRLKNQFRNTKEGFLGLVQGVAKKTLTILKNPSGSYDDIKADLLKAIIDDTIDFVFDYTPNTSRLDLEKYLDKEIEKIIRSIYKKE